MINKELIERFFKDECTPEQAREVADYLRENPQERAKYLSEEEFMAMREEDFPENGNFSGSVSSEWLAHIHKEMRLVHTEACGDRIPDKAAANGRTLAERGEWRNGSRKWIRTLVAAAVIGGVIFGGSWLLKRDDKADTASLAPAKTLASIPADERERRENRSGVVLPVLLPDGSLIRLMPRGVVGYHKKFKENRDVYLEGEAGFEVASDKDHPFTVYSGEVSTRVLGTSFHVRALPDEEIITVRLNTGKVVVGVRLPGRKTIGDTILTPGKELRYNKRSMTVTVTNFNNRAGNELVKAGNPQYKGISKPDWYKFSNQPISDVLDQLSNYFGIAIYYYPADIKQIYFEGKFEKTDSLEKILTDITLPNNLKFVREDSGILIKKR